MELRQNQSELRTQVDANRQGLTEELRKANEENVQLRKSLLDTQNQLEAIRSDLAKLRGQTEVLARDMADVQRKQKDDMQAMDERMRKLEPSKVTVDGKEFFADPVEKRDYESAFRL